MHDILLYIGSGENEELRYAIRTWVENLSFNNLYAVGGPKPKWFEPDIYVENPRRFQKMRQCYDNLRIALNDDRLTEDVILMMDDIFILEWIGDWKINYNRGNLVEQYNTLRETYGDNQYNEMLHKTEVELRGKVDNPLSFEEHAPFLCNRAKLWQILSQYGPEKMDNLLYRTLYGNIFNIRTEYKKDVKILNASDILPNKTPIVSTNRNSFYGNSGMVLRDWYDEPSEYEK